MSNSRMISNDESLIFQDMLNKLKSKTKTKDIQRLRCAIYARKSTEDTKATSLETQISYCRDMILSSPFLEEVHVFQEDNVSGMGVEKRKEFLKMFELVESESVDVIVCMAWDRFARKSSDSLIYSEKARKNNVYILTGDNSVVIKDAVSNFAHEIHLASNELFARVSAERTMENLIKIAKNGKYVSGEPPLGYQISSINNLEINVEESLIVDKIFTLLKTR